MFLACAARGLNASLSHQSGLQNSPYVALNKRLDTSYNSKIMAERDIEFIQGNYYHIYNRGANRGSICFDDEDFKDMLHRMRAYCQKFQITVIAYCIMRNHYHWLVRQDSTVEAGLLPQRVFNGYVKRFNLKHNRSGTLFEGPYHAKLVEDNEYLSYLPRYIHGNPVKDGLALSPDLWPYSNYMEWIGTRSGILVDHNFINERYPNRADYQRSVLNYLTGMNQLPYAVVHYLKSLYNIP